MSARPGLAQTGVVLCVGVGVLSFAAILVRLTESAPMTIAAWRLMLATALLGPLCAVKWGRPSLREARPALLAGLFLALHFGAWIASLRLTTVASSVVLVATSPLFAGLIASVLGERMTPALWQGVVLAVVGGGIIAWGDMGIAESLAGNLLALVGAVAAAGYLVVGRRARHRGPLTRYVTLAYAAAALPLLAMAGATGNLLPVGGDWLWIALMAIGPQLVGHTSLNWAVRRLPTAAVAVAVLGEPVGAAVWAHVWLEEPLGLMQGVGMTLVLGGILRALLGGIQARREDGRPLSDG